MRLTYTDLKNAFLDGTQNTGSTDTNLLSFFQRSMDTRYQLILAHLQDFKTQAQRTATTVASQQYYHNPAGIVSIESATVTVGSIAYPLEVIQNQRSWERLNELLISTTSIPQFIFPRRDDFGIWPIPQSAYTIVLNYNLRDRKMTNDDYATGTVTVTNNNQTVTGSGTTWTSAMIGRWFSTTVDGYWYRISGVASTTSLTLETSFEGTTGATQVYKIGESPELPEEGHIILARGTIADFYSDVRGDVEKATWFNNAFWTGDGQTTSRDSSDIVSGLIGLKNRYDSRDNSGLVTHMSPGRLSNEKLWGTTIT